MCSVRRSVTTIALLGAAAALSIAIQAAAQTSLPRPVRIVAPSATTSADLLARIIGPSLADKWKNSVIVDNRSGWPSAMLPAAIVAKAPNNGHTLLMGETSSLASAVSLFKKIEYNPSRDFQPITLVARAPFVLVVHASMPASTLREFIAHAKKHPEGLSYASAATGSTSHLSTELLLNLTGIKAVHVPYKGAGAATLAIVAGHVQFASITLSSAMSQLNTGKVRALAIASKHRVKRDPMADVPTAAEAGLNGFECEAWYGLLAPAGTPEAVVRRFNSDIVSVLSEPAIRQRIFALGAEPQPGTPEEFEQLIRDETDKWRRVIRAAEIRPE
jgi:tripartite-type tricarboxylate transporter receptor subunit TctC